MLITDVCSWNYPTNIRYGAGQVSQLPDVLKSLNIKRPLLVTDIGLAKMKFVHDAKESCERAGLVCRVFSGIQSNPTGSNVNAGVQAYREGKHDGVIAFGGGSALDGAKAIALMAGQARPLWDFVDEGDNWTRVDEAGVAKCVAIPTTAGTGSEVGRASVITHEELHEKKIIFHPLMMPSVVINDPALTVGLPPKLTAATGIDAFVHCFEAYCAPSYHPMADGIAMEGMRLVKENLKTAYEDGSDLTARGHMIVASTMGATAFQKGLGGVHAMSHPVGALYDVHHGLANAVFLPYVMMHNRKEIEEKVDRLSQVLGIEEGFEGVLNWVLEWRDELGIPHTSECLKVRGKDIGLLAQRAENDPSNYGNPIPIKAKQYEVLYEASLRGEL
ncbi:MAG: iron-containing alcohol dehydrogenase [Alphaproteobacteria bacterium]